MRLGEFARWRSHAATMRNGLQLAADARPWTGRKGVTFGGARLTERQRDLLDCAFGARRSSMPHDATTEAMRQGFWCNISQSVQRKPWSTKPPTACRNTQAYSFESDTILTSFGQMQALGWPRNLASGEEFSQAELSEIAGEGFSVSISCMIVHFYWCNPYAPWW